MNMLMPKEIDMAKELKITQAPTLVVIKNKEISYYKNVSNIKKFIETIKNEVKICMTL